MFCFGQAIEYPEIPVKKRRISHLNAEVPEKQAPKSAEKENQAGTDASASDGDQAVLSRTMRSRGKGSNLRNEVSQHTRCAFYLMEKYIRQGLVKEGESLWQVLMRVTCWKGPAT